MKELRRALLVFVVFAVGTGLAYPLFVTGIAQLAFKDRANGSLIINNGKVTGSTLIGQRFTGPGYFHGRPSANNYDAANSGGTNFGPSNARFLEEAAKRVEKARAENGLGPEAAVPADLFLASASGLDPDISLDAALLQVPRIAKARGLPEEKVAQIVRAIAAQQSWGGRPRVNVLKLNFAIDQLKGG
jgi:K+-transporting ATPase ATPase C chain